MSRNYDDFYGQKNRCIRFIDKYIEKLDEHAEESEEALDFGKAEISYTELKMLQGVLKSQMIKEPLDDVVFFAGFPESDSPCYHILVRPEDCLRMQKDPNISICHIKKFTGVMEQDNKEKKKLEYKGNEAFCAGCGERVYPRYRPYACRKCGTIIDWSDEWWYKIMEKEIE